MKIELNLNPDEALALIQVLEKDHIFPDVTGPIIRTLDEARLDWANDVRNMGYLRADKATINPADIDAWKRWATKHKVDMLDITMQVREAEDLTGYPTSDGPVTEGSPTDDEGSVYVLDGTDNLIDITPRVLPETLEALGWADENTSDAVDVSNLWTKKKEY